MHKSSIHEHASPNHPKKFLFRVYMKSIPCKFYNVLTYCSNYRLEHQPHSSPVSYVLGFCARKDLGRNRDYAIVCGCNEKPYGAYFTAVHVCYATMHGVLLLLANPGTNKAIPEIYIKYIYMFL